jgi:site-specific recombinase XerD
MKEFDDFMNTKKENAELTKKSYSIIIGKFLVAMKIESIEDLKVLKSSDLQSYINGLEVSANTKNSVIRVLKVFYNFLFDWEYIDSNPMSKIKRQKVGTRVIKMPTEKEVELIYSTIKNKTTLLMVSLMGKMGLRRDELCNIEIKDICDGRILVHGKGNKEARLKISQNVLNQIYDYIEHKNRKESDYLFSYNGHSLEVSSINKRFERMANELPISEERKKIVKRPHSYRHFCGTKVYNLTKDPYAVKHQLRQADILIGQVYVHTSQEQYDNLSELI